MTEEEAKTKWCPMYRISAGAGEWYDIWYKVPPNLCLASGCMAWRWMLDDEWEPSEQIHQEGGGSYTTEKPPKLRGYCGLAGKPSLRGEVYRG